MKKRQSKRDIEKAATGIAGFDAITGGGLPRGRPTLVCGTAGCGKTLFAVEFLVRGAVEQSEPGVFVAFEESAEELSANVRSLGFDLDKLVAQGKLAIDHVKVERSEIEETGEYNLDGLFIRLGHAIDSIKAKRVVLDTIESLFAGFNNAAILRAELRRLFGWLKEKGVTAIVTGERGEGQLTRQGLEEYVSDCVVLLDQRVAGELTTRRLRVVKYRGSAHGNNEYPFLIEADGISIMPITSLGLEHAVSNQVISTGIAGLDEMLGRKGVFRGSSVLISGTAGTGKSIVAAHIVAAACSRRERALVFAYEESAAQLVRNVRSVGIDLQPFIDNGHLQIHAARPSSHGLETHLVAIHREVERFRPSVVAIDPISNLSSVGNVHETHAMLVRVIDFLKARGVTAVCTNLTSDAGALEQTDVGVSSLVDVWLLLRQLETNGERNRVLYLLKARGMAHSNQLREFKLGKDGVQLVPAYIGPEGVLTGTARAAQESRDREQEMSRRDQAVIEEAALLGRHKSVEAQLAALHAELAAVDAGLARVRRHESARQRRFTADEHAMRVARGNGAGRGR